MHFGQFVALNKLVNIIIFHCIFSKVIDAVLIPNENTAWIGLNDSDADGDFVFLDGVKSTEANTGWSPVHHQRNDSQPQSCVQINRSGHDYNKANDFWCDDNAYALCEKKVNLVW